jgi:hypothetical protein
MVSSIALLAFPMVKAGARTQSKRGGEGCWELAGGNPARYSVVKRGQVVAEIAKCGLWICRSKKVKAFAFWNSGMVLSRQVPSRCELTFTKAGSRLGY